MRMRFTVAGRLVAKGGPAAVAPGSVDPGSSVETQIRRAKAATGDLAVTRSTDLVLRRMAASFASAPEASQDDKTRRRHAEALQTALRHLLIAGPDNQLH
jgi:hypothetical protein